MEPIQLEIGLFSPENKFLVYVIIVTQCNPVQSTISTRNISILTDTKHFKVE